MIIVRALVAGLVVMVMASPAATDATKTIAGPSRQPRSRS